MQQTTINTYLEATLSSCLQSVFHSNLVDVLHGIQAFDSTLDSLLEAKIKDTSLGKAHALSLKCQSTCPQNVK